MKNNILFISLIIFSLWGLKSYRSSYTSKEYHIESSSEENTAHKMDNSQSVQDKGNHQLSEDIRFTRERERKNYSNNELNINMIQANLAQAFPGYIFEPDEIKSFADEVQLARASNLLESGQELFYIRSLAQHRVEQIDDETQELSDDLYSYPEQDFDY